MSELGGSSILVTGGAGFVGSNLVRRVLDLGAERVEVVDNLLSAERDNLPNDARVNFVEGSIADDAVLSALTDRFDYVFHLSTYHGNQSSIHDPLADHANNLITTLKLCEAVRHLGRVRKLVYAGAGCAVAKKTSEDPTPTTEDASISLEMDSPYSISKLVGEFYALYYFNHHRLPTVRARFQNVYGPGEVLGAGQWRGTPATVWRNVIPTFIYKALQGESLPIDGEGEATRDFIFVADIVDGLIACALRGEPGDVYNLATGEQTSIRRLADLINHLTLNQAPIELKPRRDWDRSGKRFGSTAKAQERLGFKAHVPLEEGLGKTVQWTRENLDRIERCVSRHASNLHRAQSGS